MSAYPIRRGPALWIALFAAALNALSPLAAYARSGATMLPMELCSAAARAGSGDAVEVPIPAAPSGHATHLTHCGACPAGGLSLPAFDGAGLLVTSAPAGHVGFALLVFAGAQSSLYLQSRPRGPPATLHS